MTPRKIEQKLYMLCLVLMGCSQTDFGVPSEPENTRYLRQGSSDLTCTHTDDCATGEVCEEGVCLISLCDEGPYSSEAPLPPNHLLVADEELILYVPETGRQENLHVDGSVPQPIEISSQLESASTLVDAVSGNFLGTGQDSYVSLYWNGHNGSYISFGGKKILQELEDDDIVALASGDLDRDGLDDIVITTAREKVYLCQPISGACSHASYPNGSKALDVVIADIDGDQLVEVVVLLYRAGRNEFFVWHVTQGSEAQPAVEKYRTNETNLFALEALHLKNSDDGERDVLYSLKSGTWDALLWDRIRRGFDTNEFPTRFPESIIRFSLHGESLEPAAETLVRGGFYEMVSVRTGSQNGGKVILLNQDNVMEIFEPTIAGQLVRTAEHKLPDSNGHPYRALAADLDNDSTRAILVKDEPALISSDLVPLMQVHWPPYSSAFSRGTPYVVVGQNTVEAETEIKTVSLYSGMELGLSLDKGPWGLIGSQRMRAELRRVVRHTKETFVGIRTVALPDVSSFGTNYSEVWVASSCYHQYRYRVIDISNHMAVDGAEFDIMVPVSGIAAAWTSTRYNAYARRKSNLPIMGPTFEIGNVAAYPETPMRADGTVIDPDDMLFSNSSKQAVMVSDSTRASWFLSERQYQWKEEAKFVDMTSRLAVQRQPVRISGEHGFGGGTGRGLAFGDQNLFGGGLPALPDNPDTPEDEYKIHKYSVMPHVYKEWYRNKFGEKNAYFVHTFTVGRRKK